MGNVRQLKIHNSPDSKHELVPLVILSRRMLRVIKLTSVLIWSNAGPECFIFVLGPFAARYRISQKKRETFFV